MSRTTAVASGLLLLALGAAAGWWAGASRTRQHCESEHALLRLVDLSVQAGQAASARELLAMGEHDRLGLLLDHRLSSSLSEAERRLPRAREALAADRPALAIANVLESLDRAERHLQAKDAALELERLRRVRDLLRATP